MMCVRSNTPCMPSTQITTSLRAIKLLWRDVTHCCEHGNSSVLQLGLAAALEVLHTAICGESSGIPKSNRILHSELVLECTQRRSSVVGPVSPLRFQSDRPTQDMKDDEGCRFNCRQHPHYSLLLALAACRDNCVALQSGKHTSRTCRHEFDCVTWT